jgi:hypothetical protein
LCSINSGNWSLTFNVSFDSSAVSKPTATTQAATNLQGDGATLAGSVNPNGGATTVWFEWGATNALGNTTPKYLVGSGTSALSYTKGISGLASNSPYYFRIDAGNSAGTSYGSTVPFSTLSTLHSPNLLSPQSGAVNVSTTPQFSWTGVNNATSYRILVATTAAALPSDPTSAVCGAGCVIDNTPTATSYTPAAGILTAGTQYFWQVHARSPLQYGAWSSISNFTPGLPSIAALSVSPSGNVASGSSTTITVTLNAPAPSSGAQVALSDNNTSAYPVPASVTVPAGSLSANAVVQTGTVSASSTITVTGTYNGAQTATVTVVPENAQTTTTAATSVTGDSAVLNGTINPQLDHGTAQLQWGTDPVMRSYNASCSESACPLLTPNTSTQSFSYSLSGLSNSTNYYFRMVFYDSDTGHYQYGAILTFITVQGPSVTTTSATSVGAGLATLNGSVNPLGANGYTWFEWGTDPTMKSYSQSCWDVTVAPNSTVQPFSCAISGLASLTVYYFRFVAYDTDTHIYEYGLIQTFTTIDVVITPSAATGITSYSATLNGTVNPEGASGYAYFQFCIDSALTTCGTTSNSSLTANTTAQAVSISTTTAPNSITYNGSTLRWYALPSGTTFYYRTAFHNQNNIETNYGPVQQFATAAVPITSDATTGITSYSATLNGTVNPEGAPGYAYFQFCIDSGLTTCGQTTSTSLTANTTAQAVSISTTTAPNSITYNGSTLRWYALPSGTTFYYQTVFHNSNNAETKYGPVQQFTTSATPVTTGTATGITSYSATLNGTVNPEGAPGYAYFQFCIDSGLTTCGTTSYSSLTANTTAQTVSISTTTDPYTITYNGKILEWWALPIGTTIYYQTVFHNSSNGEMKTGPMQQFTTAKVSQAITFTDSLPASAAYSAGLSYTLSATGGASGNPVTFSLVSGPATVTGSTLAITGGGVVVVAANQAGNTGYAAAPQVTQSIVIYQAATLISPTPGSTLTGSSATFSWNPASATAFGLYVGTTGAGSQNIYFSGVITATSANLTGLPTYGQKVYVRLSSKVNGTWQYNDYTYTEGGSLTPAFITTPTPGSTLAGSSATFAWNPASATAFGLYVGTTGAGSQNIFFSGVITATSASVTGLPTYGQKVYVRLSSKVNGVWETNDYTYTEGGSLTPAFITTPTPGSTLAGSSATFTWNPASATAFGLYVGTSGAGSQNIYYSGVTTATSVNVTGLPTTGKPINVRLSSKVNGVWKVNDYVYTTPAFITTPTPGTSISGSSATFSWNLASASEAALYIGTTYAGSQNIYYSGITTASSVNVSGLPTAGQKLYIRLSSKVNGKWVYNDYVYTAQ